MHRISNEAGPHLGSVVGFASMVPLMVTAPFALVLAGAAFLAPWKTPLRAFAGGLLRIAISVGCGIAVMAILLLSG